MIENVLHLIEAAAEPQSTQVDPGTSFHSWCRYHIPSEGDGKSLTINVRGVPLKIISSDQRYYNLEVLAPNKSALRFTSYDKNNCTYIAVELAKSRTRNEAARIATAPDSIVHDATNVQEFLKALFSIKSRGASILNRLVPPGAAHAAAEPELPVQAGDAFAKLWLEFMPREKTVTVQGVSVVLESMDSHPNSIEATLPGGVTYCLCQSDTHDYQYRIWRVGARKTGFEMISGKLQPRAMLSQFLQVIISDWKQDQATAAVEPRPAADLFLELQRYVGKTKLENLKTKSKVTLKSVYAGRGHDIHLAFVVRYMLYDYNAHNTGGVFMRAVEDNHLVLLNLGGPGARRDTVKVAGRELDLTEDATQLAKKVLVLLMRGLLSEANLKTKKTIPPVHDHPSDRTSQASAEPVPDTLQAIAHTLESWVGRVYSRDGEYVAGIQSACMDTRGGATFPKREVLMIVTSVQRGREILGTTPHHVVQDPKTREIVVLANPGAAKPDQIGRARITDPTQAARWILHTIATRADPLRSWR